MRSGIIAGGNWIVDHVKLIGGWPPQDTLVTITAESRGNGGSPYNILKDLAKLGAGFPREAVGLIGDDDLGRWILADCRAHGIDTRQLRQVNGVATSYTDVMTVRGTGRRTFFHQRGANAKLAPAHFDFSATRARFFHLGYLLLLDTLDAADDTGRPQACAVLEAARRAGLRTSVDLVSEASERFARVVTPVLPLVDCLFLNDYEAAHLTSLAVRSGERVDPRAVEQAAQTLLRMGVGQWVVIHFPEGAFACSREGAVLWQAGLRLAPDQIKGAAGAGDAFAAGILYGLHEDWPMERCLRLGVSAAATSLFDPTCSEGILTVAKCFELAERTGFQVRPVAG